MAIAMAFLMAGVFGLGWQLWSAIQTNNRQSEEIRELRSKLSDKTARDLLELQESCANRSEQIFHQSGYTSQGLQSDGKVTAVYQNHYNPIFKKCFMTIETMSLDKRPVTNKFLLDALEQRELAE